MNTILKCKDMASQKEYHIIKGTGYIFDHEQKEVIYGVDDIHEATYPDRHMKLIIDEEDEVVFYIESVETYDSILTMATTIKVLDETESFPIETHPVLQDAIKGLKEVNNDKFSCEP